MRVSDDKLEEWIKYTTPETWTEDVLLDLRELREMVRRAIKTWDERHGWDEEIPMDLVIDKLREQLS
jgi:hypothetical protein